MPQLVLQCAVNISECNFHPPAGFASERSKCQLPHYSYVTYNWFSVSAAVAVAVPVAVAVAVVVAASSRHNSTQI